MQFSLHLSLRFALVSFALAGCDWGVLEPILTAGLTTDTSDSNITQTSSGDPEPATSGDPTLTTAPSTSETSLTTGLETSEPTLTTGPVTSEPSTGDSDTGGNFVPPDPPGTCDVWQQDCPAGQKCSVEGPPPYTFEAITCSAIVPDPAQLGESCEILVEGHIGPDTCDLGLYCHDVDAVTGQGTCIPMCTGSQGAPVCADPDLTCLVNWPPLCIPKCDPLAPDCATGQSCVLLTETFVCWPVADDSKQQSDACEYVNHCEPGLACTGFDVGADCDLDLGCCSAYCDLAGPDTCPGDLTCRSYFILPEDAPDGHENVGICALP